MYDLSFFFIIYADIQNLNDTLILYLIDLLSNIICIFVILFRHFILFSFPLPVCYARPIYIYIYIIRVHTRNRNNEFI